MKIIVPLSSTDVVHLKIYFFMNYIHYVYWIVTVLLMLLFA